MKKMFNKTAVYLILIVLLAGTLRIIRAFEERRYSVDVYQYFQMAEDWAYHGADYVAKYDVQNIPPLLPWLMAMGYNLGFDAEHTGLIVGIILGSLVPVAAFWIALNLFSHVKRENDSENALPGKCFYALLAAFLMAVSPFFVRISVSCLREILYLPLIAFAMAFAVSAIYNKSLWKWCVFAAIAATATMARREGVGLIVIFIVWQLVELLAAGKDFRENIKYHVLSFIMVLGIFSALLIPVLNFMSQCGSDIWIPFFVL